MSSAERQKEERRTASADAVYFELEVSSARAFYIWIAYITLAFQQL